MFLNMNLKQPTIIGHGRWHAWFVSIVEVGTGCDMHQSSFLIQFDEWKSTTRHVTITQRMDCIDAVSGWFGIVVEHLTTKRS